jgi:hypothetical protein
MIKFVSLVKGLDIARIISSDAVEHVLPKQAKQISLVVLYLC